MFASGLSCLVLTQDVHRFESCLPYHLRKRAICKAERETASGHETDVVKAKTADDKIGVCILQVQLLASRGVRM